MSKPEDGMADKGNSRMRKFEECINKRWSTRGIIIC